MPFIRVSYMEQQYEGSQLAAICDTIMSALIQHFHVPPDDLFQVFHSHKREEFYYDNQYLGVERSDGLVYIQITCKSGRTIEQKQGFYGMLAKELAAAVPMREEDVFVVVMETEFEDWSFGRGEAQMLQLAAGGKVGQVDQTADHIDQKADQSAGGWIAEQAADRTEYRTSGSMGGQAAEQTTSRTADHSQPPTNRTIASSARETYGEIAPAFVRYSEDVLFGDVWRRGELSLRDRSLITIAALMAGGMTEQLPYHLRLAIDNGLTVEEVTETFTHLAFYAGWPRAASALSVVKEVLA